MALRRSRRSPETFTTATPALNSPRFVAHFGCRGGWRRPTSKAPRKARAPRQAARHRARGGAKSRAQSTALDGTQGAAQAGAQDRACHRGAQRFASSGPSEGSPAAPRPAPWARRTACRSHVAPWILCARRSRPARGCRRLANADRPRASWRSGPLRRRAPPRHLQASCGHRASAARPWAASHHGPAARRRPPCRLAMLTHHVGGGRAQRARDRQARPAP